MNVQPIVAPTEYPNYVAAGRNIIKSDFASTRLLATVLVELPPLRLYTMSYF